MDRRIYDTFTGYGRYQEQSFDTPGWSKRRIDGLVPPNNRYEWYRVDLHYFPKPRPPAYGAGFYRADEIPGYASTFGSGEVRDPFGVAKTVIKESSAHYHSELRNALRNKLMNNEANLATALAEFRGAAELFYSYAGTVVGLLKAVRHHSYRDALRYKAMTEKERARIISSKDKDKIFSLDRLSQAADAHLEFSFAVRPLVSDMAKVIESLARGGDYIPVQSIKVGWRKQVGETFIKDKSLGGRYGSATSTGLLQFSARIDYYIDNPLLYVLDQLGLLNPFQLAWELVPYSFVIDWFANIGGMLGGALAPRGVVFERGYTYVKGKVTNRCDVTVPILKQYGGDIKLHGYGVEEFKSRYPLTGMPMINLHYVHEDMGAYKCSLAIALLYKNAISLATGLFRPPRLRK